MDRSSRQAHIARQARIKEVIIMLKMQSSYERGTLSSRKSADFFPMTYGVVNFLQNKNKMNMLENKRIGWLRFIHLFLLSRIKRCLIRFDSGPRFSLLLQFSPQLSEFLSPVLSRLECGRDIADDDI